MEKIQNLILTIKTKSGKTPKNIHLEANNKTLPTQIISNDEKNLTAAAVVNQQVDSLVLFGEEEDWEIELLEVNAILSPSMQEHKVVRENIKLDKENNQLVIIEDQNNNDDVVRIRCQPLAHPLTVRFCVNEKIHDSYTAYFGNAEMAEDSPLAEILFSTGQIQEIVISHYDLTVTAVAGVDWNTLAKKIGSLIRDHIVSGKKAVHDGFHKDMPSEQEIAEEVEIILEQEVNPQIASHGGFIRLLEVKDNNVYLEMGGGCQGCGAAVMTLKMGVEKAIREMIPQIGEIFDQTDHAAGVNPYYPRNSMPS